MPAVFEKNGNAGNSSATATSVSFSFPSAGNPSAGALLVAVGGRGAATGPGAPSGFGSAVGFNNATNNRSGTLSIKTPAAGNEATLSSLTAACWCYFSFTGLTNPVVDANLSQLFTNDLTPAIPSITPTAGRPAVIFVAQMKQPASPNPGPSTFSGSTGLTGAGWSDTGFAGAGNRYRLTVWFDIIATTSGSYGGGTLTGSGDASEDGVVLTCAVVGDPEPVPEAIRVSGQAVSRASIW